MQNSEQLLALYHLDRRLDFILRRLAEIPLAQRALAGERAERETRERARAAAAAELAEALRRLERESASLAAERSRLQTQQRAVTDMHALAASEHQLARCEERIAGVEATILVKLEAQEIHERELALRAGRDAEVAGGATAELAALAAEAAECTAERDQALAEREALLGALPAADARLYRRLAGSHGHRSLVGLHGASCGGCGAALPPQELLELRDAGRVIVCQGCGRLVLRTEGDA
jgi:predicted  nucleic acid-binding Zn-ribbon protein